MGELGESLISSSKKLKNGTGRTPRSIALQTDELGYSRFCALAESGMEEAG